MTTLIIPERLDIFPELRNGRHIEHDPKSLDYKAVQGPCQKLKALVTARTTSITWKRWSPILNQGELGSCTGNAITGLLGTEPFVYSASDALKFDEDFAVNVYKKATIIDGIPGAYPPEDTGSSGLAVAKVIKQMGLITRYNWATTTNELIYALRTGPVIVGVPWFESFFTPDRNGQVRIGGSLAGGHEFLIRGYNATRRLFLADNSWGTGWGIKGSFTFSVSTWDALRKQQADVTVPRR